MLKEYLVYIHIWEQRLHQLILLLLLQVHEVVNSIDWIWLAMFVQIPNIGTATHISYHNQPQNPLDKFYICIAKHIIHNLCQNICTYIFCLQIGNWAFFQPYTVMILIGKNENLVKTKFGLYWTNNFFMDERTYICTYHRVLKVPLINHEREYST